MTPASWDWQRVHCAEPCCWSGREKVKYNPCNSRKTTLLHKGFQLFAQPLVSVVLFLELKAFSLTAWLWSLQEIEYLLTLFHPGIFLVMQPNVAGCIYAVAMYMVNHLGRPWLAATARFLSILKLTSLKAILSISMLGFSRFSNSYAAKLCITEQYLDRKFFKNTALSR